MGTPVTSQERNRAIQLLQQVTGLIGTLTSTDDISHALVCTAQARDRLDEALNEFMAAAALEGESLRAISAHVGLAPNSVAARMSKSESLSGYSTDGRVRSEAVYQARADKAQPMIFQRRRPT